MQEFRFEAEKEEFPQVVAAPDLKDQVSIIVQDFLAAQTGAEEGKFWVLPARTQTHFPIEPDSVFDVYDMREDADVSEATKILRFGLFQRNDKALLLIPSDEAKGNLGSELRTHLFSQFDDANSLLHAAHESKVNRKSNTIKIASIGAVIGALGSLAWYGVASIGAHPRNVSDSYSISAAKLNLSFEEKFAAKLTDIRQQLRTSSSKDLGRKVESIGLADLVRLKDDMLSDNSEVAFSALDVYKELVLVARESNGTLFNNRDLSPALYSEYITNSRDLMNEVARRTTSISVRERALGLRETLQANDN